VSSVLAINSHRNVPMRARDATRKNAYEHDTKADERERANALAPVTLNCNQPANRGSIHVGSVANSNFRILPRTGNRPEIPQEEYRVVSRAAKINEREEASERETATTI